MSAVGIISNMKAVALVRRRVVVTRDASLRWWFGALTSPFRHRDTHSSTGWRMWWADNASSYMTTNAAKAITGISVRSKDDMPLRPRIS